MIMTETLKIVFSTYVEVFLRSGEEAPSFFGFLHVCGGVSQPAAVSATACGFLHIRGGISLDGHVLQGTTKFSPHTWGCFRLLSV